MVEPQHHPHSVPFGYRDVKPADKAPLVREVFRRVAPRYDLMNDLMSGGIHRLWKAEMLDRLCPRPGEHVVDVAGGTGDVAFGILDRTNRESRVTIVDLTPSMLEVGRDRAIDRGILAGIAFVAGDAENLPLPARTADAVTCAFGLRNVTDLGRALTEAHRVLRPGGRFLGLEFSRVDNAALAWLYDRYSFSVLPALGRMVAGDADAYRYLAESIRRFPAQGALARLMQQAGFARVGWRSLSGGIAALHWGWRI